ncbi:hypothetical protein OXIME_000967 [Oxyplasma meridianum]|uniref:Helix-turn-helix domain-containing protein n=1 Tax=Oxyplasma meridianum TaxID=3073602 RepID=A0AAX4NHW7_9ARCH
MLNTDDKRFIIQSVENGYKVSDLARMFNVTPRRVQQILKEDIDEEHTKKRYSSLTDEDVREIENLWNNYKVGSRTIFYLLKSRGRSISYYQIYNYMRGKKMIRTKYSKEGELSKSEIVPPSPQYSWTITRPVWIIHMPLYVLICQQRKYSQWLKPEKSPKR